MAPSRKLRAVVVDDEELARQLIKEYLEDHPRIEIAAECSNGFEAVKVIAEIEPDLVFLDVQMPKLNGFEVLELLEDPPAVVFVTAHEEFALKAFEAHAVDYLLKPFSPERLDEAISRALQSSHKRSSAAGGLAAAARPPGKKLSRVLVKDGNRVTVIPVEDIDYLEAQDDYVAIHAGGRSHLKQQTLSHFEAQLDPEEFVRVHRSYILNIRRLARLELYAKDSRLAVLNDGRQLPVSRAGYSRLRELL